MRATSETVAPGSSDAATSRSFSPCDHRRRRSTDVITSACEIVIALLLGLPLGPAALAAVKQGGRQRRDTNSSSSWMISVAMAAGLAVGGGCLALAADGLKALVEQAMSPSSAEESVLPNAGPPAQLNKKLVSVVCASGIEGCRAISDAQVEAAKALGWSTQIIDGRGNVKGWNDAIQSAILNEARRHRARRDFTLRGQRRFGGCQGRRYYDRMHPVRCQTQRARYRCG